MRHCLAAFSAAMALAASAVAGPASAAEQRLSGDELRDLVRRELLWCDDYDARTNDCDVVSLLRFQPDGSVSEASTLLLQEAPRLVVYIADTDRIVGDSLCGKVEARRTRFSFTINGQAMTEEASDALEMVFRSQMADLEGKTVCQSFFRGEDPNVVREEITVDGQRRTDLESTYHLREGDSGLNLRPRLAPDEDTNRTVL